MRTDGLRTGTVADWLRPRATDDWLRPAIVLISATALVIVIATGIGAPWRVILALWFALTCPGLSLAGVLGLRNRFTELVMVVPLSLAAVTLTSLTLFYTGVWAPDLEFGVLSGLCLAGLIFSHLWSRHDVKEDA